jgi:hypothetical protein
MAGLTLTPGVRTLLGFWGSIQAAANAPVGTRGVAAAWNALRTALNLGPTTAVTGVATLQDMNQVYGLAVSNRTAFQAFSEATPDSAVTAAMIGSTPNARSASVSEASPLYNVRVPYTYTTGTETVSDWVTVQIPSSLTGYSAGDLTDLVTTLAAAIITSYGVTTVTFTDLQISAA